ncbi:hypothetical protein CONCODRAFT_10661 [Conidiobolus coronatus NRRL 28638]|uniref:SHSP domain-containing protein n=1 Tax=Conidiobolus coronatus (strain ATCC 28846 / CBS 209.66 / NRRL 28638) TaxID=796925 RepID=A0A137NX33_CONC2|nr:hypothetical protein CONCODRAFT_10661 [Conidiobolus coronatus NRRL 28638]|eukprot:KXN67287.1 hypothetical protein CONCODRAFT_10661 [Conidiobolus coronatus NRRL 28638]
MMTMNTTAAPSHNDNLVPPQSYSIVQFHADYSDPKKTTFRSPNPCSIYVTIDDTSDYYTLLVDLPKIPIERTEVDYLHCHKVTITVYTLQERTVSKSGTLVSEKVHGKFIRGITLPEGVSTSDAIAEQSGKKLTIRLPKVSPNDMLPSGNEISTRIPTATATPL